MTLFSNNQNKELLKREVIPGHFDKLFRVSSFSITLISFSDSFSSLASTSFHICKNSDSYKSEALTREKVHYSISKWIGGKPDKLRHLAAPDNHSVANPDEWCTCG